MALIMLLAYCRFLKIFLAIPPFLCSFEGVKTNPSPQRQAEAVLQATNIKEWRRLTSVLRTTPDMLLHDLNVVHQIEKTLKPNQKNRYLWKLFYVVYLIDTIFPRKIPTPDQIIELISATATQRIEALSRVLAPEIWKRTK